MLYRLRNFVEEAASPLLDKVLGQYPDVCKCEKCKLDIKAYALNHISPKYVVTDQGEIYTRVLNEITPQDTIDIIEALIAAVDIVSKNPKH